MCDILDSSSIMLMEQFFQDIDMETNPPNQMILHSPTWQYPQVDGSSLPEALAYPMASPAHHSPTYHPNTDTPEHVENAKEEKKKAAQMILQSPTWQVDGSSLPEALAYPMASPAHHSPAYHPNTDMQNTPEHGENAKEEKKKAAAVGAQLEQSPSPWVKPRTASNRATVDESVLLWSPPQPPRDGDDPFYPALIDSVLMSSGDPRGDEQVAGHAAATLTRQETTTGQGMVTAGSGPEFAYALETHSFSEEMNPYAALPRAPNKPTLVFTFNDAHLANQMANVAAQQPPPVAAQQPPPVAAQQQFANVAAVPPVATLRQSVEECNPSDHSTAAATPTRRSIQTRQQSSKKSAHRGKPTVAKKKKKKRLSRTTTSGESTCELRWEPTESELRKAGNQRARQSLRTWYEKYRELVAYKQEFGDCLVPQKYEANKSLGIWVNKQRMEKKFFDMGKKSSMTEEKVKCLEAIGFVWAKRKGQASWDEKYELLCQYHAKHGNSQVPTKYHEDTSLGRWVSSQRGQYRKYRENPEASAMTEERIAKLEAIGFIWNMSNGTD